MVDYPIDITTNVKVIDKASNAAYSDLIAFLSKSHNLSSECKSRINDFVYPILPLYTHFNV